MGEKENLVIEPATEADLDELSEWWIVRSGGRLPP